MKKLIFVWVTMWIALNGMFSSPIFAESTPCSGINNLTLSANYNSDGTTVELIVSNSTMNGYYEWYVYNTLSANWEYYVETQTPSITVGKCISSWGVRLKLYCPTEGGYVLTDMITVNVTGTNTLSIAPNNSTNAFYFGDSGQMISWDRYYHDGESRVQQVQSFQPDNGKLLASEPVYSRYHDVVGGTLEAPIGIDYERCLFEESNLFMSPDGLREYDYRDFDSDQTRYSPTSVVHGSLGTLGGYFGPNNSLEPYVDINDHPFQRFLTFDDGANDAWLFSGISSALSIGSGHEFISAHFPIINELDHYMEVRQLLFNDMAVPKGKVVVEIDQNNVANLKVVDVNGKVLLTAQSGDWLEVDRPLHDKTSTDWIRGFNLGNTGSLVVKNGQGSGSGSFSKRMLDEATTTMHSLPWTASSSDLANVGIFKLSPTNVPTLDVDQTYSLGNLAYYFYDDLGRLICGISPKGVKAIIDSPNGVSDFSASTLPFSTSFTFNIQGLLSSKVDYESGVTSGNPGTTKFLYSDLFQIRFSQTEEQRSRNSYTYFNYDGEGRLISTGEYIGDFATFSFEAIALDDDILNYRGGFEGGLNIEFDDVTISNYQNHRDWKRFFFDYPDLNTPFLDHRELVHPLGDKSYSIIASSSVTLSDGFSYSASAGNELIVSISNQPSRTEENVFGRVAFMDGPNSKTWFSYGPYGEVAWAASMVDGFPDYQIWDYEYSIEGKLVKMIYSDGFASPLIQEYEYDYSSRLKNVFAYREGETRTLQAKYVYYTHGPLKRVELGDELQGLDYVYTAEGMLKGINHLVGNPNKDPGGDGFMNNFSEDVFAIQLQYYPGDYSRSSTQGYFPEITNLSNDPMYNGMPQFIGSNTLRPPEAQFNVATTGDALRDFGYAPEYDNKYQLTNVIGGYLGGAGQNDYYYNSGNFYSEKLEYDPNGNITSLKRYNWNGLIHDNLGYTYAANSNRLLNVANSSASATYTDFPAQVNYSYDAGGRLSQQEMVEYGQNIEVRYNAKGLVSEVYDASTANLSLLADISYNERDEKVLERLYDSNGQSVVRSTWYTYNINGSLSGIYSQENGSIHPISHPFYGQNRLGSIVVSGTEGNYSDQYLFEISDHTGSTRVVLLGEKQNGEVEVVQINDYFPFGRVNHWRSWDSYNTLRTGYQGLYSEEFFDVVNSNDPDVGWNQFSLRMYDPAIGRWISPDNQNQYWSGYLAMNNNPLVNVDPSGGFDDGFVGIFKNFINRDAFILGSAVGLVSGVLYNEFHAQTSLRDQTGKYIGVALGFATAGGLITGFMLSDVAQVYIYRTAGFAQGGRQSGMFANAGPGNKPWKRPIRGGFEFAIDWGAIFRKVKDFECDWCFPPSKFGVNYWELWEKGGEALDPGEADRSHGPEAPINTFRKQRFDCNEVYVRVEVGIVKPEDSSGGVALNLNPSTNSSNTLLSGSGNVFSPASGGVINVNPYYLPIVLEDSRYTRVLTHINCP